MIYSYPLTLARRAVVVTMDCTAINLHELDTNHWLMDSRNVVLVRLSAPAWAAPPEALRTPRDRALSWGVSGVVAFYESRDAGGLARVLQQNSVNGADLLAFESPEGVQRDLRLPPFAAAKILSIRDAFLAAS